MSDELERDLEEWLVGGEPDDYVPSSVDADLAPEPARDTEDANRILRGLAALERDREAIDALCRREREKLAAWQQDRTAGIERQQEWLARRLEGWARANWERDDQGHVWKLPAGTVQLRKAQPRCALDPDVDPDAVEKVLPAAVERRPHVSTATLKALAGAGPRADSVEAPEGYEARLVVTEDGEVVPGAIMLVPTRLNFSVTPGK